MNQAINTCITGLNNIGQGFWDYATGVFIQASVLIILLLILDFVLRKRVRAVFRYCLWMLLFVKLVMPASFTLPTGIGYWLGDYFPREVSIAKFAPQIVEAVPMTIDIPQRYVSLQTPMMNETVTAGVELESISWQGLAFSGWLVGIIVLLALLVRRICFVRRLIAKSRPANERLLEMLEECRCQIGIRRNIELRLSGNKLSPAVCGLFKPIILIPGAVLEKLSREKLKAVLIHELAHIKRGDGWVNLLQTVLQIVYFYNPLVWIANAMIRRVREQAVDEMVLVTLRPEAKSYSNMLIDIAEMAFWKPNISLRLVSVVESKKALERRINHMLTRPVPKNSKLGCLGLIAIVVIGAVLLPMGRNSIADANVSPNENSKYYKKADIPPTSTINEQGHIVDKVDYPFVNDKKVIGGWKSVDFVLDIDEFDLTEKRWKGDLYLNNLIFEEDGKISGNILTWTKDLVLGDDTASKYIVREIDGSTYMFFEWKSGDYTIRHMRPHYYVLRKVLTESLKYEPMFGKKAYIPPTSTINKQGHIVDKINYPFINDPKVIGTWKSVDFVGEMKQFKIDKQQWKGRGGELFLNELMFARNGRLMAKNDKVPNGYAQTWTKGLVLSNNRTKTASKYTIKEIDGSAYMFYEWKSGDYTFRHRKPSYYVLKKVSSETGGLAEAWASQPSDAEFARQLPAKIEQLNIDAADLEQVKEIFGKPAQYLWGKETFTEDNLPKRYILIYPSRFHIYMRDNQIVELRHESGSNYVFRGKLRSGSTLDEVFEVIGHPKKTVQGENSYENGVLCKDIDGRKGHCYYGRYDQNVRLWFLDYKIIAIYMTRSDYGE